MAGAKSNNGALDGRTHELCLVGRAGGEQGVACRYRVTLARVAANHQVSRQRDTGRPTGALPCRAVTITRSRRPYAAPSQNR